MDINATPKRANDGEGRGNVVGADVRGGCATGGCIGGIGGDDVVSQREVTVAVDALVRFRDTAGRYVDRKRLDGIITDMRSLLRANFLVSRAKNRPVLYDTVWSGLLNANAPPPSPTASSLKLPVRNAWRYGVLVDIVDRSRLSAALAVALGIECEVGRAFATTSHYAVSLVWRLLLESALENDVKDDDDDDDDDEGVADDDDTAKSNKSPAPVCAFSDIANAPLDDVIAKSLLTHRATKTQGDNIRPGEPQPQRRRSPVANALVDELQRKRRRYGLDSSPETAPFLFIDDGEPSQDSQNA
jgi:hypothetical protein